MARSFILPRYYAVNFRCNIGQYSYVVFLMRLIAMLVLLSGCVSTDYADKKAYDEITIKGHKYLLVKSPDFDGLALSHAGHCRGKHY